MFTIPTTLLSARRSYAATVLADNPAIFWELGDASSPAVDSSGNGRNGTVSGPVVFHEPSIVRSLPFSMSANSNSANVTIANGLGVGPGSSISLESWIQPGAALQLGNVMFGLPAVPPTGLFGSYVNANGSVAWGIVSENTTAPGLIVAGNIYHIVSTYDGATQTEKLYINGVQVGTRTPAGSALATLASIGLGGNVPFGFKWFGKFQAFAFYLSTINGTQIANHYNAGV